MSVCIRCDSTDAELFRGDDDRHRIRCHDCGYEWGPFVSPTSQQRRERIEDEHQGLDAFVGGGT